MANNFKNFAFIAGAVVAATMIIQPMLEDMLGPNFGFGN